ncbi:AAA family ATPase [Halocatena salina]|uniref:AAA family ATPase n=1 Tax=Halocatena salina TaxID=2934340 RepID=A0A8U0A3Q5_9EURY|nr:AAA family ATPase [Halocatena salina]UPM43078.1 AAA family ATPase [Halocatena salina]
MGIIGTVGLPGSGKGEAASVARELDIPVVTMGDVIREECRARGLDPADHHGEIAVALREEEGPTAIADRSIERIREAYTETDTVLVDGIRSDVEVERFEAAFGSEFRLVAIEAPFDVRKDRIDDRDRDNATESLEERDRRELAFGMDAAIENADVTIENTSSIDTYYERIHELLQDDDLQR